MRRPRRGEIWYHKPNYIMPGNLYNKDRPVVVVGNDPLNSTSDIIMVVPCTKQQKKGMESHSQFSMGRNLNTAMAEQARPVLLKDLVNYKTTLTEQQMFDIDMSILHAYGLHKYIKEEYLNGTNKG